MWREEDKERLLLDCRRQAHEFFRTRVIPQEAEDLVSEVVLRSAVAMAKGYVLRPPLVHVICREVLVDYLRWRQRHAAVETTLGECADCSVEWEAEAILRIDMHSALKRLTRRERALLEMRFIQDMDYVAIADALNIRVETAKKGVQRSLKRLGELLDELEGSG